MITPVTHPYFDKFKKENPKAYKEWTQAELYSLMEKRQRGWTISLLSIEFRRSEGAIYSALKKIETGVYGDLEGRA